MSFVQFSNLHKVYNSDAVEVKALDGISVEIEEGAFVGVMGPSGSGKSTMLSILGGLCHPTEGAVVVDGIDLYQLNSEKRADFRREYLGFVFQAFNLIPYLTAEENVMLPLAVKKIHSRQKKEMAHSVLQRVGLGHRAGHLPNQLSGGEQERVAIARALVNEPPLILADEPTGSLDTGTSREIMQLLSVLNKEGQTIVMVTHNDEVRSYFDRTLLLRDGLIAKDVCKREELYARVG
ncbi:ABC transporter ATP-binding protein [Malonomonas rubra]|uniref:ABC transporter ATP-binding protein n=1 Tax=Malonomonas rubra TaxID=57040 RepID=UPI0026EF6D75|nr:ABC transporter ATP-binding protein [Malonomonas rubra]